MNNSSDVSNDVRLLTSDYRTVTRRRATGVSCCCLTAALILSMFVGACLALPTNPARQATGRSAVESEAGRQMKSTSATADCSVNRRHLCYSAENFHTLPPPAAPEESFESALIHYDEESLTTLCSLAEKARSCWQGSSAERCEWTNTGDEITDSAVEFMCSRGRTGYIQHRICLRSAEFTGGAKQCNVTYQNSLAQLRNDTGRNTSVKIESVCRDADTYVTCVTTAATRTCGREVGEWVEQFKLAFMQPVKNHVKCDALGETSRGKPETPVVMYVVLSVLLAMISTLALAMTVRCTGLDQFFLLRPSTSNSNIIGRQHRLPDQQNGDRHLIPSTSASKKKKPLTGKKPAGRMLFRLANVGGRAANGGECVQGVGLANGPGSSVPGSARTKGHRLELPLVSDSSPGTERTVSEMANNNSPHRPLLQTTSSELPLAIDDTGN